MAVLCHALRVATLAARARRAVSGTHGAAGLPSTWRAPGSLGLVLWCPLRPVGNNAS